jgi:XTP/dITP diphosphohydrolase
MNILIASNNQHKIGELGGILRGHTLIRAGELFPDFDPEETGSSFLENSLIKARELWARLSSPDGSRLYELSYTDAYRHEGLPPVLADDSGLCVDALGGGPGIYSARFGHEEAGRPLTSSEQNDLLLEKLRGIQGRSARYICCMTLIAGAYREFTAQEPWEGEIAVQPSAATGGFGYDPIFHLADRNCTVADITDEEKQQLSHRGKATRRIAAILESMH